MYAQAGRRYRGRASQAFDAAVEIYRRHGAGQRWIDRVEADKDRFLGTGDAAAHPDSLSAREVEVLRLIAAGRSNREIGTALFLSVRTVERHIANIYGKTNARGRAEATAYALRQGLVPMQMP